MTDINIDEYINYINNNNNIKGEKCMICHMNDTHNNLLKLNCNHYFHKHCLSKKMIIKCKYCNKKTKIKSISKNISLKVKCKIVLSSGKNKGNICNRINCGYHKKI
tara:strand:- start:213 stop:530 length:318 start_codon:yes stop_codon:yes gene_type:complete